MLCLILWQIWYTTALTPWKTLSESALKVDDTLCIKVRKISIVCIIFYHCLNNERNNFRSNFPFCNCSAKLRSSKIKSHSLKSGHNFFLFVVPFCWILKKTWLFLLADLYRAKSLDISFVLFWKYGQIFLIMFFSHL